MNTGVLEHPVIVFVVREDLHLAEEMRIAAADGDLLGAVAQGERDFAQQVVMR